MLTDEQRTSFDNIGYVRLPQAFSKEEAQAMEDQFWAVLNEKYGADPQLPTTWDFGIPTGLHALKSHPVFGPIGGEAVLEAIDDLLGKDQWKKPEQWGQLLITFPGKSAWNVPAAWHTDFDFLTPPGKLQGVLLFSFIADVAPQGGGTSVIAGSHHLVREFVKTQPSRSLKKMKNVRKAILESDPWLAEIAIESTDPSRVDRFLDNKHHINNIPLEVKELTGKAGDVILAQPWLLHSPSPNGGSRPRFMRIQRIHRERAQR